MRIAVLGDIHGNLMALDAVMTDLDSQAPDEVWCAGDIAWGGLWPADCIARVRQAGWPTVRGNTDVWITGDPQGALSEEARRRAVDFAKIHAISDDDAAWLLNLPLGHSGQGSLLMVHGTPESCFVAPEPDDDAADFKPYEGAADIVIYGHIHRAFVRRLADGTIVANTGSVGLPRDGDGASYLLVDLSGADWVLRHRRVAYDRRAVIAQAKRAEDSLGRWLLEELDRR